MNRHTPAKVAELCATVNEMLAGLSESEKLSFWQAMLEHPQNHVVRSIIADANELKNANEVMEFLAESFCDAAKLLVETDKKLQKHRRPIRNAERDKEIMRLHAEGKSSGQIVNLLKKRWAMTSGAVRLVINRNMPTAGAQ